MLGEVSGDASGDANGVLVVHSDNGGDTCHAIGDVAPWGSNWPLRGRKMSYFEGGVRCAMTIYVAHLMKASRTKSMVVVPSAKKAVAHLL